jgi:hypothetical protein
MFPNQTSGFHYELFFKKDMVIKLYAGNYATLYGLVNGVDDTFQYYTKTCSKIMIWINFYNPQIGINMRIQYSQTYKYFLALEKNWTLIEWEIAKIQIGNNLFHIIKRIQFSIQLNIGQTIHCAQGLTLDPLAFDHHGVTKDELEYTTLPEIHSKNIYIYFFHCH